MKRLHPPVGSREVYSSGSLSGITNRIGTVSLDGVTFAGVHSGAVGTGEGAPFGNYMDVAVSTSLTFNNINAALTGQGGGSFFANNPTTYGSAFLLANGPQITVTNSTFDEAGYRNALSLWGGAVASRQASPSPENLSPVVLTGPSAPPVRPSRG